MCRRLVLGSLLLMLCGAVLAADTPSAESVVARAEARFASLTDYQCRLVLDSVSGTKTASGAYRVWFKKPHLLRLHVERGKGSGSDVVLTAEGKVRARKGGLLKPFVVTMSPRDGKLRSIRGVPVVEIDWGSFYRKLRAHAALRGARLSLLPHASESAPWEVQVSYAEGERKMREVYRIDPERWVLLEGDVFENDRRVDHVGFSEIQLDTGLSERFFRM